MVHTQPRACARVEAVRSEGRESRITVRDISFAFFCPPPLPLPLSLSVRSIGHPSVPPPSLPPPFFPLLRGKKSAIMASHSGRRKTEIQSGSSLPLPRVRIASLSPSVAAFVSSGATTKCLLSLPSIHRRSKKEGCCCVQLCVVQSFSRLGSPKRREGKNLDKSGRGERKREPPLAISKVCPPRAEAAAGVSSPVFGGNREKG